MLRIKDAQTEYQYEEKAGIALLNGQARISDLIKTGANKYHILLDEQSYTVELIGKDESGKKLRISVNGHKQELEISDKYDALLKQLGMENMGGAKAGAVKAPMPGMVLSILVHEGDFVKKGDQLVVLEAMKMENSIKAQADGHVKKIHVTPKQAVEKNQLMLEMEA